MWLVWLAIAFVLSGAIFLAASLFPVARLLRQLPEGRMRRHWQILAGLISGFFCTYLVYAAALLSHPLHWSDFTVPAVFFFGAIFVWLTARLAVQTAIDLRRVAILEKETITDALMGIYNRRYLDRRLEEEFVRAKRYKSPLSVLMIDIDYFKRINDELGHRIGDEVLIYLAKLLLQNLRQSDIVARYGGEEIAVIVPQTRFDTAAYQAERMRHQVESHRLLVKENDGKSHQIRITVSVGVATLTDNTHSAEQLLDHADQALYRAKEAGRNRVITYRATFK